MSKTTTQLKHATTADVGFKQELSRMISAAVINQRFCQLLLNDPLAAIGNGYNGERFTLADDQRKRLNKVRASSLKEFAAQIAML